jgi:hypothetical protein
MMTMYVSIITLHIIILWDNRRICGASLTEMSYMRCVVDRNVVYAVRR